MNQLRAKVNQLLGGKLNLKLVGFTVVLAIGIVAILSALNSPKAYRISNYASGSSYGSGSGTDGSFAGSSGSASNSGTAASGLTVTAAKIYVHVVGLVVSPGIYELNSGSRLFEAIFAAGGFAKGADQSSVNLARQLSDGEQIMVTNAAAAGTATSALKSPTGTTLISLNRGSQTELESLPRVGPALASRIIDWRTSNGGFKSVRDLLKVTGIGQKMFAEIEKLVTL